MFRELQSRVGFGWATRIMGFIALGTFAVSFAAFGCFKVESKKPRALVDTQALREPAFMTYIVALSVIYAGFFVPYFYIPTYATQHLSTSSDLAFYLLAITNAGGFIGRLLPGVIPKILARPEVMLLATAGGGLLVLAWIAVRDIGGLVVFCLLYGIVSGAILTMTMVMVPALAPHGAVHETIGTRLGMSYFGQGIGILVGSPIAGVASNTMQGDFKGAQIFSGLMLLGGATILIYPWMVVRRKEFEQ